MLGKQGMKHYPIGIREKKVSEYNSCVSQFELSRRYGITPSMSRRGNPYDNALAENFFSILKTECIHRVKLQTYEEARLLISEYIHFYNNVGV